MLSSTVEDCGIVKKTIKDEIDVVVYSKVKPEHNLAAECANAVY